jgi:hypothetical protein
MLLKKYFSRLKKNRFSHLKREEYANYSGLTLDSGGFCAGIGGYCSYYCFCLFGEFLLLMLRWLIDMPASARDAM